MIRIGTVNGDVIESGGVKNVTNHYHYHGDAPAPPSPSADLKLPPDTPDAASPDKDAALPDALRTPRAEALLAKLSAAGLVDARWQPQGLSNARKGTLADYIAMKLGLAAHWKLFAALWGMNSETLRVAFHKGLDQKSTCRFLDELKQAMGE